MGQCTAYLPNGINKDCLVPLREVEKVIFTSKSMKFTSISNALSLTAWKTKIQTDLSLYVVGGLYDYEPTTADPAITELPSTRKIVTNRPIPSATLFLEANFCDYQEILKNLKGGQYGVIYQLKGGQLYMRKNSVGEILPFSGNLDAVTKGIPLKEMQNNFPVFVNHINYDEFTEAVLLTPDWNPTNELISYMPVGLTVLQTSAVAAGVVSIQVNERCGDGYAGLLLADFEVLGSNGLTSPIVGVLVDNGLGSYTITLQKDAVPAAIAAGDYMTIRAKKLAALVVTHLSNRITIFA